ncbi:cyclin-like protein [Gaertneriomyces semiglobifer]|nr:cyclin-like protein [Gaertneriomyces semiglobifer]
MGIPVYSTPLLRSSWIGMSRPDAEDRPADESLDDVDAWDGDFADLHARNKWYFTQEQIQNSPSRRHGIHAAAEAVLRDKGTRVIVTMAMELNRMPRLVHTACLYFHRFYMRRSFREFNHFKLIAATCLWIATKLDGRPVRTSHIAELTIKIMAKDMLMTVDRQSVQFDSVRRRIIYFELEVFEALCFDTQSKDPYNVLLDVLVQVEASTRAKDAAATVLNDMYFSILCLQYEAKILVGAAIALGARLVDEPVPIGKEGQPFNVVTGILAQEEKDAFYDSLKQMVDFYQQRAEKPGPNQGEPGLPQIRPLRDFSLLHKRSREESEEANPDDSSKSDELDFGGNEHNDESEGVDDAVVEPPEKRLRLDPEFGGGSDIRGGQTS